MFLATFIIFVIIIFLFSNLLNSKNSPLQEVSINQNHVNSSIVKKQKPVNYDNNPLIKRIENGEKIHNILGGFYADIIDSIAKLYNNASYDSETNTAILYELYAFYLNFLGVNLTNHAPFMEYVKKEAILLWGNDSIVSVNGQLESCINEVAFRTNEIGDYIKNNFNLEIAYSEAHDGTKYRYQFFSKKYKWSVDKESYFTFAPVKMNYINYLIKLDIEKLNETKNYACRWLANNFEITPYDIALVETNVVDENLYNNFVELIFNRVKSDVEFYTNFVMIGDEWYEWAR